MIIWRNRLAHHALPRLGVVHDRNLSHSLRPHAGRHETIERAVIVDGPCMLIAIGILEDWMAHGPDDLLALVRRPHWD